MGFGLLFIGYFLAYAGSFTPFSVFTYILGFGIILLSLKNLIFENRFFAVSAVLCGVLEIESIAVTALYLFAGKENAVFIVLQNIQGICAIALSVLLLIAILIISKNVGLPKIQAYSTVNLGFTVSCFGFSICASFLKGEALARVGLVALIAKILSVTFALFIIFNCYMRICYEGDEKMDGKSSVAPLRFLNDKLNDAMDETKHRKGGKKR